MATEMHRLVMEVAPALFKDAAAAFQNLPMGKNFLRFIYREKFSINQGLKIVVIPKKIGGSVQRIALLLIAFRQYRTNELVRRRMNFSSDAMADFEGLLEVNRKICKQQMAEKASPTLPTNCAVLP